MILRLLNETLDLLIPMVSHIALNTDMPPSKVMTYQWDMQSCYGQWGSDLLLLV